MRSIPVTPLTNQPEKIMLAIRPALFSRLFSILLLLLIGSPASAADAGETFEYVGTVETVTHVSQSFTMEGKTFRVEKGLKAHYKDQSVLLMSILQPGVSLGFSGEVRRGDLVVTSAAVFRVPQ
jgi:hypothetical protein